MASARPDDVDELTRVNDPHGSNMLHHSISQSNTSRLEEMEFFMERNDERFPGYTDLRILYLSSQVCAYRAYDTIRNLDVVLKACLDTDQTSANARLRHEWNCQLIFSEIGGIKIPRSIEACNDNKGIMLVFSDECEKSASEFFDRELAMDEFSNPPAILNLGPSGIDLTVFLKFAIGIVEVLDRIHQNGITHGNINPLSIGIDAEGQGLLFDMSYCTFLEREDAQIHEMASRQLPFMSPESSGRINRSIDYRSDFYSLGVCFYLILTGRCPFTSDNALDLIYHHIAHVPIPPHAVCPDIPLSLSSIVLKMMEKTAEDRYQTGQGLISDLTSLQHIGTPLELFEVKDFVPGLADAASIFSVPQKLFGRDAEIKKLLDCFESVKRLGGGNVAIIKGGSGTGKSSLVNEIQRPVLESRSFFASGKFDQYKRGVPFFSLLQAAGELVRQLVSESDFDLSEWKEEILAALGNEIETLFEVLPEVRSLYGQGFSAPTLAKLGPSEREQRFTDVFLRFILIFAKKGTPLVLFLDDIQWSSVAEMNLVASLAIAASKTKSHSLTLVIAYRDNEVPDGHHVLSMLRTMQTAEVAIAVIEVKSMPLSAVRDMVSGTLRIPADQANVELETLTKLILAKTEGNAFFITQVLRRFKDCDQIFYDFQERLWKFDLASILRDDLPTTVIDLLLLQIHQLNVRTRECLQVAACLGNNRFSLKLLSVVSDQRRRSIGKDLWTALQAGLLIPTSSSYKTAAIHTNDENGDDEMELDTSSCSDLSDMDSNAEDATFRFLHDRVQQASYQLIQEEARPRLHLSIGFRLLNYYDSQNQIDSYIFEVVNQINRGLSELPEDQLETVIKLNLKAGRKALQSTAFDAAMQYLKTAKDLAPVEWWHERFDLILDISFSHVDATYAVQDYTEAITSLREISRRARSSFQRAQVIFKMIDAYMGLDDLHAALEVGLQGLECLGVSMPRDAASAAALEREQRAALDLTIDQIDAIATMEITHDEEILLFQSLATSVLLPLYLCRPELLKAVSGAVVLHILHQGLSEAGAYPLVLYGLTVPNKERTMKTRLQGYHLGLAAVKIVNSTSASSVTSTTPKVLKVFASHICYWNDSPRACLVYFNSAIATGTQSFNVEYTCYAHVESCSYAFWSGEPVSSVVARLKSYLPFIKKFKMRQMIFYATVQLQSWVNLTLENQNPADIDGEHFSMALEYDALLATDSHPQIFVFFMAKLFAAVYFQQPINVVFDVLARMKPYAPGTQGLVYVARYNFLICSALVLELPSLSAENVAMFYESFSELKSYRDGCPQNFEHEVLFIEAELLRHEHNDLDALDRYESAYNAALSAGNIHEAAHFSERTYLWLESRNKNLAQRYLIKAFTCFKVAGIRSKTRDLKCRYPDVLNSEAIRAQPMEDLKPFRSVNMQMNRDGTLSKVTSSEQPGKPDIASMLEPMTDDRTVEHDNEERAETEVTAHSRTSVSLHLRNMPTRTFSQPSNGNLEDDLTPTGTMSSFISKTKRGNRLSGLHSKSSLDTSSSASAAKIKSPTYKEDLDLDVALKASVIISDVLQVTEVLQRLIESVLMNAGADYGALILVEQGNLYIEATGRNDSVNIVSHELLGMKSDLVPSSLIKYVARLRETTVLGSGQEYRSFQSKFGKDPYFQAKRLRSIMCMPVQNNVKLIGILYLENSSTAYVFSPRRVELLNFLCTQAAIAIEKARLYHDLGIAKDEAQASNKMKSEFLSTISHEIRTPFNAVLGMSGFLLDTQLSPMQIDYVETIRNSSKELLRVIDDILDFSKMEHGTFELHKEAFSLRECIEGAMQITAERAASKELELAYFNCHNDVPDVLVNDITRFRQVVINLLGNSIKFTEKGSVTILSNATLIKPATMTDSALYRIQVSVRDTGIGIKEEDHKKLFKLFSQIDSSLARSFSGTGLGLAISEKLVRLMDGQIWVESKAGHGSIFHFTIVTPAKAGPVPTHPLMPKLQGLGVLILDDSEVASKALSESLEWLGMAVHVTKNLSELTHAIAMRPKGSFRIALIDLHYGLADEVIPQLAIYDPACKVIRLSRFGFRQKFNDKYEYLIKPVKRERLARVVAEALYPDLKHDKIVDIKAEGKFNPVGMATNHPLRILLAEDNLINSRVAIQHLKRLGYSAVHAKDGQYCIEEEEKAIYDVILMDVQMPRLDGCQAATKIRAKYAKCPLRCPRIIAMTANAMRGDMERCLESGMHAYCQKPIIVDVLAQCLLEASRRIE